MDAPKARRVSRACDFCHRRGIRCRTSAADPRRCGNCVDFGQQCTYERAAKKRGVRSAKHGPDTPSVSGAERTSHARARESLSGVNVANALAAQSRAEWRPPRVASQALVVDLIDVYFEVIYPIFPLFHRPTLLRKVSRGEYLSSRPLFAAVMSICALASARARDGAIFSENWDLTTLREPPSEAFYDAAKQTIPEDLSIAGGFDYLRSYAILALTDIQYGQIRKMHHHLGLYHSLVAMDGLHDEANWPQNIGIVETEERRRLFWSIYTLEVYSSIVWNGIIRCREAQSAVLYPTEADDENFSDRGFESLGVTSPVDLQGTPSSLASTIGPVVWLRGWNFTTDLYRILEHAVDHFRRKRPRHRRKPSLIENIFGDTSTSQAAVLQNVMTIYSNLPQQFKETTPVSLDLAKDRFSFQAANIAATVQLVRVVLFTAEEATIETKCQMADEFIQRFATVPVAYLRAISSPLLHHLAGIGSVLGSVFEDPLSESDYERVRKVLLSMADVLANLEAGLFFPAGASERLRTNVTRIDEYMQSCRQERDKVNQAYADWQAQPIANLPDVQSGAENHSAFADPSTEYQTMPQFQLPSDLLEDWRWAFDFTQPLNGDVS